ncbi:hypothetical protein GH714_004371 [Hevea brasiliensis]|uniref:Uncharacterized protein n=1 Tax=Hevea brasiliensis TaxID=3981 RepID=A0A6A6KXI3_HEVBR|nr:hypothetical protein GH714_004371 [Hevea brasiliensis]
MAKLPSTFQNNTTHKRKMKNISFSDWELDVAHLLLQLSNVYSVQHQGGGDGGDVSSYSPVLQEIFGEEEDGYPKRRIKRHLKKDVYIFGTFGSVLMKDGEEGLMDERVAETDPFLRDEGFMVCSGGELVMMEGSVMVGRWWKYIEGMVATPLALDEAVDPAL